MARPGASTTRNEADDWTMVRVSELLEHGGMSDISLPPLPAFGEPSEGGTQDGSGEENTQGTEHEGSSRAVSGDGDGASSVGCDADDDECGRAGSSSSSSRGRGSSSSGGGDASIGSVDARENRDGNGVSSGVGSAARGCGRSRKKNGASRLRRSSARRGNLATADESNSSPSVSPARPRRRTGGGRTERNGRRVDEGPPPLQSASECSGASSGEVSSLSSTPASTMEYRSGVSGVGGVFGGSSQGRSSGGVGGGGRVGVGVGVGVGASLIPFSLEDIATCTASETLSATSSPLHLFRAPKIAPEVWLPNPSSTKAEVKRAIHPAVPPVPFSSAAPEEDTTARDDNHASLNLLPRGDRFHSNNSVHTNTNGDGISNSNNSPVEITTTGGTASGVEDSLRRPDAAIVSSPPLGRGEGTGPSSGANDDSSDTFAGSDHCDNDDSDRGVNSYGRLTTSRPCPSSSSLSSANYNSSASRPSSRVAISGAMERRGLVLETNPGMALAVAMEGGEAVSTEGGSEVSLSSVGVTPLGRLLFGAGTGDWGVASSSGVGLGGSRATGSHFGFSGFDAGVLEQRAEAAHEQGEFWERRARRAEEKSRCLEILVAVQAAKIRDLEQRAGATASSAIADHSVSEVGVQVQQEEQQQEEVYEEALSVLEGESLGSALGTVTGDAGLGDGATLGSSECKQEQEEDERKEGHEEKMEEEERGRAVVVHEEAEDTIGGISFARFSVGQVAMFFPTPEGNFLAFNVGCPSHVLSKESQALVGRDEHFRPYYVLGRIIEMQEVTCEDYNAFGLPCGQEIKVVSVETITPDLKSAGLA